jgi:hypothetical protein
MLFERVHRSKLVGIGIQPLRLAADAGPDLLELGPGDRIEIDAAPERIEPRAAVQRSSAGGAGLGGGGNAVENRSVARGRRDRPHPWPGQARTI